VRLAVSLILLVALAAPAAAQSPPAPQPFPRDEPDPSIRDGSAQRALDRARKRWRRADIHNYRFELSRSCFCPPTDQPIIFVRNDRPLNATGSTRHVATVPRLHRRVQDAIDDGVADLGVRYDRRGIPREISIDGHRMIADDEVAYGVERFWRGTRGRGGPERPA
jgi:Family of unknown function (DUF6174)